ncbi:MAG: trypsin-like peptidase domain-containing protein [bacterium]
MRPIILVAFGLLFGVGMVAGFGGIAKLNIAFGQTDNVTLGGPTPNIPQSATLESINTSFKAVAKAIQPTIVSIKVKSEAPKPVKGKSDLQGQGTNPFRYFFQSPNGGEDDEQGMNPFNMPGQQGPSEGLGSGVIVTADGYILTNNHVVENAAKKGGIIVKLTNKHEYEGHVVGVDPTTDLAVVKIDATGLPVAALGNSDEASVGEWVLAVGNPLGLESTVTTGIVSSIGRNMPTGNGNSKAGNYNISNFIQTDAAINPGNSGGGLFNARGQVIGINAMIATTTGMFAGYGFAIPINLAKAVAMDIIKTGHVNRGIIGVRIKAIDQTEAEALGLGVPRGVRIDRVDKGSAGEAAGLREGDVILSVNGEETNESNQLQGLVAVHHVGDNIMLKVWRDGREIEKSIKLRARPDDAASLSVNNSDEESRYESESRPSKTSATFDNIGVSIRNLNSSEKEKYDVDGGVYVSKVVPGSEAYDRALGPASIVTQLGGKKVSNVDDFERIMNKSKGKALGMNVIDNNGDKRFLAIKVPND